MNKRILPGLKTPMTRRLIRAGQQAERRRVSRDQFFSRNRDLSNTPEKRGAKTKPSNSSEARFLKWKQEKALKKQIEQQNKKPVFKVSVVHHHFYSPPVSDRTKSKPVPCHPRGTYKVKAQPSPPKRITRATQKRLEAKKALVAIGECSSATPAPSQGKSATKKSRTSVKKATKVSIAPKDYTFKVPSGLTEMPLFGRYTIHKDPQNFKEDLAEELKMHMAKPWPTSGVTDASKYPQKRSIPMIRQMAIDQSDSSDRKDNVSSETFSSNNKNEDEINVTEPKSKDNEEEPCNTKVNTELETPPRSGSPAPAIFSPYVTMSRGKDSARKERRSKMGIGRSPPDKIPTKDTVMQSLNISVEEEERTAQYFKFILQREIDKFEKVCAEWEEIKSEPELTEDARYLINQAIGQTRLLVKKKFERFRGLVLDCETGEGTMLVQCRDLQGFWDMMYMEIKDCESRFQKLEALRSKGWIEEDEVIVTKRKPAPTRKKAASKATINAKSSARSWIMAKKKEMLQTEATSSDIIVVTKNGEESRPSTSGTAATREATPSRRSTRISPQTIPQVQNSPSSKPTPRKTPVSLLKQVQMSEASKSLRSPLAVMKVSKMCKTPEVRLDDTISYVNSDQTPSKGILKKPNETSTNDFNVTRSLRKVDFSEDPVITEKPIDECLENSIDLGRALARIDSYDSDESDDVFEPKDSRMKNITLRRIEKRLDFEDESFNATENVDTAESSTVSAAVPYTFVAPNIRVTQATPARPSRRSKSTSSMSSKRSTSNISESPNDESISEAESSVTRVLRNRTLVFGTPKRNNRRSSKSMPKEKSYIDLDSSTKENNDPQSIAPNINELDSSSIDQTGSRNGSHSKRRRSTRKSVRLNEDDCSGCAVFTKSAQPTTPRTRRSRKISLLGDNQSQTVAPLTNGDLMTFDSPSLTVL